MTDYCFPKNSFAAHFAIMHAFLLPWKFPHLCGEKAPNVLRGWNRTPNSLKPFYSEEYSQFKFIFNDSWQDILPPPGHTMRRGPFDFMKWEEYGLLDMLPINEECMNWETAALREKREQLEQQRNSVEMGMPILKKDNGNDSLVGNNNNGKNFGEISQKPSAKDGNNVEGKTKGNGKDAIGKKDAVPPTQSKMEPEKKGNPGKPEKKDENSENFGKQNKQNGKNENAEQCGKQVDELNKAKGKQKKPKSVYSVLNSQMGFSPELTQYYTQPEAETSQTNGKSLQQPGKDASGKDAHRSPQQSKSPFGKDSHGISQACNSPCENGIKQSKENGKSQPCQNPYETASSISNGNSVQTGKSAMVGEKCNPNEKGISSQKPEHGKTGKDANFEGTGKTIGKNILALPPQGNLFVPSKEKYIGTMGESKSKGKGKES